MSQPVPAVGPLEGKTAASPNRAASIKGFRKGFRRPLLQLCPSPIESGSFARVLPGGLNPCGMRTRSTMEWVQRASKSAE